jgi:hypothetical protein
LARSIVEGNSPLPLKQLHAILDTLYPLSFKDIPQPELFELPMRRHNDDDDDTKSTYKSIHTLLKGTNKNET